MALKKDIQTQYGITAGYWRLDNLHYSKAENQINFSLLLYPSKEIAQIENVFPLENRGYSFSPSNSDWTGDIRVACYNLAKQCPSFEGAEDI
jgi:hypothetical protein